MMMLMMNIMMMLAKIGPQLMSIGTAADSTRSGQHWDSSGLDPLGARGFEILAAALKKNNSGVLQRT